MNRGRDVDIEMLLNEVDDDDDGDIDVDGVDVDQLLNEDDDDDDDILLSRPSPHVPVTLIKAVSTPVATANIASPHAATNPVASTAGHKPLTIQTTALDSIDSAPAPVLSPSAITPSVPTTRLPVHTRFSDSAESLSSLSSSSLLSPPSKVKHTRSTDGRRMADALEIAEHRERRFLDGGRREIISALQVKLSKLREANSSAGGMTRVHATRLTTVSSQLARHVQVRGPSGGAATCICVHPKFIAVGTSRGLVLLFDHFQELRQVIGSAANQQSSAGGKVTSICVSSSADMILSGYEDGKIILWDVLKGTILRQATDIHSHPITAIRSLPTSGTTSTNEFTAISSDSSGAMYRLRYYRSLLSGYVVDSECLLNGQGGDVLCMEPLLKPPEKTVFSNTAARALADAGTHAVALSSSKRSFLIQVYPSVSVLYRWGPPEGLDLDSPGQVPPTHPPKPRVSVAWQWVYATSNPHLQVDGNMPMTVAVLRSWETVLELLMLTPESGNPVGTQEEKSAFHCTQTMRLQSPILATKWLGSDKAVLLTEDKIVFVRTDTLVPLEQIQLDSAHLSPTVLKGISEAVSMCDDKFYLLLQEQAYMFGLQSWFEQVDDLVKDGQWLDALALVLDQQRNVDVAGGYAQPIATRKAQELSDKADSYLLKYVTLSIDNSPRLSAPTHVPSTTSRSHYHMMAGVSIEYCLEAMRTDLLFGEVYAAFKEHNQSVAFLETLEPYILNIKIESIPPVVLADLVELFKNRQDLMGLERCLVHLNPREMDLHSLLMFTASTGMMLANLYIYSQGLRDYAGAFQVAAESIFLSMPPPFQPSSFLTVHQVAKINSERLLLFVYDTFSGRMFPRRLPSTNAQDGARKLLDLLLTGRYPSSSHAFWRRDAEDQKRVDDHLASIHSIQFPYLMLLAGTDVHAFFRCMQAAINNKYALQAPQVAPSDDSPLRSEVGAADGGSQSLGSMLSKLHRFYKYADKDKPQEGGNQESKVETDKGIPGVKAQMLALLQDEIVSCDETIPKQLIKDLLDSMLSNPDAARNRHTQEQITKLARKHTDIFDQKMREELERRGFWRALLTLLKSRSHIENVSEFNQALRCYLNEQDMAFQAEVFTFIDEVLSFVGAGSLTEEEGQSKSKQQAHSSGTNRRDMQEHELKVAIIDHIVDLWAIDRDQTKALAVTHLGQLYEQLVKRTTHNPNIQFQLLEVLVKGHNWKASSKDKDYGGEHTGRSEDNLKVSAEADAVAAVEGKSQKPIELDEHTELLYVTLLATYKPDRVYEYLSTHPIRAGQDMLQLCRQKKLVDAIAYLLEKSGDVQGALSTVLHEITSKLHSLRKALDRFVENNGNEALSLHPAASRVSYRGPTAFDALDHLQEWLKVKNAIGNAIRLCQRHDGSDKERAEALWFDVLDTLLKERTKIKQKGRVASAMATAIGRLVTRLVEPMSRSVGPEEIVKRIIDGVASSGSSFAEYKEVMFSMLETYSYQMSLFEVVNKLLAKDSHQSYEQKLKLKRGGVRVTSIGTHLLPATAGAGTANETLAISEDAMYDIHVSNNTTGTAVQGGEFVAQLEDVEESKQEPPVRRRHRAKFGRVTSIDTFFKITEDAKPILDLSPAATFDYEAPESRRPGSMPIHARFLSTYSGVELS